MEDNVIVWKPCYKVGGLVVYVTRYGDLMTIDSLGRLTYKSHETRAMCPASAKRHKSPQQYQRILICNPKIHLYVHRLVAGVY